MKRTRPKTSKELKKEGFKLVNDFDYLFINENGKVYDTNKQRFLKPTSRNYIKAENKLLSVPKLVLMTFDGKPYKRGQIQYIDGNKSNLSPKNIKYIRLFAPEHKNKVNQTDLITAIRCYFEIDQKYKIRDNFHTRLFLQSILKKRLFFIRHKNLKHIDVYLTYLGKHLFEQKSITETAKQHFLSVRDCLEIVNNFTNILITEILQDLEKGYLKKNEFSKPKRNINESLQDFKEYLNSYEK